MSPEPTVSVVVCAYTERRWDALCEAVRSTQRQTTPPEEVVVVIDHNPQLLQRAMADPLFTDDGVRVLANARRQGLSGARNTAIDVAHGEVLAFLDDDASAEPDWLATLLRHYQDPVVIGVGGCAIPRWPAGADRPVTLPAGPGVAGELDWVVGCSYRGMPTTPSPIRNLMGCNMSMRAGVFERIGGFNESLGRIGRTPLGCEETEWCIRARQDRPDSVFVHDPAARVHHDVSPDRLTWSYLLHRSYAEGVSKAAVSRLVGDQDALSSERSYVRTVLPRAAIRECRRRSLSGALSVGAVASAVLVTATGYLRGRADTARRPFRRRDQPPAGQASRPASVA